MWNDKTGKQSYKRNTRNFFNFEVVFEFIFYRNFLKTSSISCKHYEIPSSIQSVIWTKHFSILQNKYVRYDDSVHFLFSHISHVIITIPSIYHQYNNYYISIILFTFKIQHLTNHRRHWIDNFHRFLHSQHISSLDSHHSLHHSNPLHITSNSLITPTPSLHTRLPIFTLPSATSLQSTKKVGVRRAFSASQPMIAKEQFYANGYAIVRVNSVQYLTTSVIKLLFTLYLVFLSNEH